MYTQSWSILKNHPIIVLPSLIATSIILFLSRFISFESSALAIVIYIFLVVIIGIKATAASVVLINKATLNKQPVFADIIPAIKQYAWKVFVVEFGKAGAYFFALLICFILMGAIYAFNKQAAFIIAALVFIVLAIHLFLGFMMRFPTLIREQTTPINALKLSYRRFTQNRARLFIAAILILATFSIVDLINSFSMQLAETLASWIGSILYVIVAAWSTTYLFLIYPTLATQKPKVIPVTRKSTRKPTRSRVRKQRS